VSGIGVHRRQQLYAGRSEEAGNGAISNAISIVSLEK